jgi:hypothetical protein
VTFTLPFFIYLRLYERKFEEVLNKQTLKLKKIRNLKMKVLFHHTAGRDNRNVMHIQQH